MTELLAFRAPDDLVQEIKDRATKSGKSRTDVIIEAIRIGMGLPVEQLSPLEHRVIELENQMSDVVNRLNLTPGELVAIKSPDPMVVPIADLIADDPAVLNKKTRKKVDGETFKQLANRLEYPRPDGYSYSDATEDDLNDLITYAKDLGKSFNYDKGKRRFFEVTTNIG